MLKFYHLTQKTIFSTKLLNDITETNFIILNRKAIVYFK